MNVVGIEFARPLGLAALLLPAAVLWLARTRPRAPTIATGALALWEAIGAPAPRESTRSRGRVDPPLVLLAIGLAIGAIALAGPRRIDPARTRTWRVVVDRSPTMYRVDSGGEPPIAIAARDAERWLAEHVPGDERVLWIAPNGSRAERSEGASLPSDWLVPPRIPRARPRFEDEDRAGTLWLTRAPLESEPRSAGVSAARIAPTHGPIAVQGSTRFDWDGEQVREVAGGASATRVALASGLPDPIESLALAWASARGHAIQRDGDARDTVLTIRRATSGDERAVEVGRDGWLARGFARGRARVADEDGDLAVWLDAGAVPIVTVARGRVETAWSAMERPSGDPAAFAVSWAELLDDAVLPHPSIVPLAERMASAPQRFTPPRAPPAAEAGSSSDDSEPWIAAWLSFAVLVLALAAWQIRRRPAGFAPDDGARGAASPR